MTAANRITLRPLTATEYAAFRARSMQDYAEEMRANVGVTPEAALERARTQTDELLPDGQATPGHHFLGIVRDDQLVGDLWINLRDHLGALEAFGFDFHVDPELRDAGVGRRAMELAADWAREQGAARLALNVFGDNARARHLYASFGFHVTMTNMAMPLE